MNQLTIDLALLSIIAGVVFECLRNFNRLENKVIAISENLKYIKEAIVRIEVTLDKKQTKS